MKTLTQEQIAALKDETERLLVLLDAPRPENAAWNARVNIALQTISEYRRTS